MLQFKKGDVVTLNQPVISGPVVSVSIINDEIHYLVEYVGTDGETHTRYFKEDELILS